ncbi:C-type lectin domain-containing protein [Crenothrix polyspora]|uniref:C-type lectin domain-containing protein n=1 Tax=Crenothrix polyspora TaxID=360316 RepID=A0A1R4H7V5_9GAMM|nr:C-type lectin domain-containing protein [Crenothrix polyspora]SJM92332.1 exported hypothetical protein [Crenothrix polyspora]
MSHNKNFTTPLFAILLIGSSSVLADTGKLVNPANNHTYQMFDSNNRTWDDAKADCTKRGAHLATITSLQENTWIWGNFGSNDTSRWLGGTNEVQKGIWTWITGEPWAYVNWSSNNEPSSPNYLVMRQYGGGTWLSSGGPDNPSQKAPYICEWEAVQYLGMTPISNKTKGKPANYALIGLNGGTYSLLLIDGVTGKKISSAAIGIASNITFKSFSATDDFNGDNVKDIAVLLNKSIKSSAVMIFSGTNAKPLKTLNLPTQ